MRLLKISSFILIFFYFNSARASWTNFRQNLENNALKDINIGQVAFEYDRKPWSFQTEGLVWGTPVIEEGVIYVGSASKKFFAINETSGKKIWEYQIYDLADSLIDSAAALSKNLVVIPGGDGYLHALNKKTGMMKWVFKAYHQSDEGHQEGEIVNSFEGNVTIGPQGNFYAGSDNGHMYCVDSNGKERWNLKTNMMIWSSPAFIKKNKWMVFGSLDRHLYIVNYETGKLVQKINLQSEVKSSPAFVDGAIYIGTSGGEFFKFYVGEDKLSLAWNFSINGEIYSSPLVIRDKVVFGSLNGIFYALKNSSGKLVWSFDTYSSVASSPVGTKDGVIIFGAKNGKLYSLDSDTGERLWSFRTSNLRYKVNLDSSPAISNVGSIFVGSYNGNLFRVPFEYCRNHPFDGYCQYGGKKDIPQFIEDLDDGDHFLYLKRNGSYVSADGLRLKRSSIIKMRFVSKEKGNYLKDSAISPIGLKVWINGHRYKNVRVSADGKFLNFIPPKLGWGEGIKHVKIKYGIYSRGSWLKNRLKMFFTKKKTTNLVLKIIRKRREGERSSAFNAFYGRLINGESSLGVKNLFLYQPSSLETYIPAAMDGQQFLIRFFELESDDMEIGTQIGAFAIPATYKNGNFSPMSEVSRTFHLDVNLVDYHFIMSNPFYLSAMGGGINFSDSIFEFTYQSPMGNFFASANCLRIKGNGESYAFPLDVIDNTCDQKLRVSAFGRMSVSEEMGELGENTRARVRSYGKKIKVHLRKALDSDKLLTLVYLNGSKILRKSILLKKGDRTTNFEFKKAPPKTYKVFLNTKEILN